MSTQLVTLNIYKYILYGFRSSSVLFKLLGKLNIICSDYKNLIYFSDDPNVHCAATSVRMLMYTTMEIHYHLVVEIAFNFVYLF